MFFSKNKSVLGVDIGTANIKIAQITPDSPRILETYGLVDVAYQIDARNNQAAIIQTAAILKNLAAKARVTTKRCIASLPNSAVFTSVIDMPKMSEKDLDSAMEFEAKKYVPLPLSEIALSWSVVSEADPHTTKVLLTAVPKQIRESYIQVFGLAGLELEVIEIEALALIRALLPDLGKNSVIIIDIGAKSTGLNVIENGLLQLTRNLSVGGDTITEKISQSLGLSAARAEQFKKDFGLSETGFLPETFKPILDSVKNEVKQLLAIYQSQNMKMDKLILVGGGANLPGILDYFGGLGVSAELGNPLKTLAYTQSAKPLLARYALQLPIAAGLAQRV